MKPTQKAIDHGWATELTHDRFDNLVEVYLAGGSHREAGLLPGEWDDFVACQFGSSDNEPMERLLSRAKAFSCESAREYEFMVDENGDVLVYDNVAGHYVYPVAMSKCAQARIRKIATRC